MSCDQCGTATCHRTNINPYCTVTVRVRCEGCGNVITANGLHFCEEETP